MDESRMSAHEQRVLCELEDSLDQDQAAERTAGLSLHAAVQYGRRVTGKYEDAAGRWAMLVDPEGRT
ncbi:MULTISPECIES: hypothetical protein [Streptomyces]|uniref:hypothetical protein n=1 Tax=Streptomyces TaxID=1883 RepID=UPI002E272BDE